MRCYFSACRPHRGRRDAEAGLSDKDAIAKAHSLFSERKTQFDGFEVWDQTRFLFRHPDPDASTPQPGDGTG